LPIALLVLIGPEAGTGTTHLMRPQRINTNEASSTSSPSNSASPSSAANAASSQKQCGSCTLEALNPRTLTYPIPYTPPPANLTVTQTVIRIITYNAGRTSIGESFETRSVTLSEGTQLSAPPPPSWFTFGTWL
jgi:hypothetical protein